MLCFCGFGVYLFIVLLEYCLRGLGEYCFKGLGLYCFKGFGVLMSFFWLGDLKVIFGELVFKKFVFRNLVEEGIWGEEFLGFKIIDCEMGFFEVFF